MQLSEIATENMNFVLLKPRNNMEAKIKGYTVYERDSEYKRRVKESGSIRESRRYKE